MGVVVVHSTPDLSTIGEIQDSLSNQLARGEAAWNFEIRLYRVNPASHQPPERTQMVTYIVASSDYPEKVCVICGSQSLVLGENFTQMIQSKLQSLWVLRHTIKGEGHTFILRDLTIRFANAFVQGNFRGLIVQVEADMPDEKLLEETRDLFRAHNIPGTIPDSVANSRVEIARGYLALHR